MVAVWLAWALLGAAPTPEGRAVAFLAREVPQWRGQNGCYSCHNNGDAARALYAAKRAGYDVPDAVLRDTAAWLRRPDRWEHNGGDEKFNDKTLTRIQFGSALLDVLGDSREDRPLREAAALVAETQQPDGSWKAGFEGNVGSPITYGPILATHFARRLLQRADARQYADNLSRADDWLRRRELRNVLEAASLLLAFGDRPFARRGECLALVRKARDRDGGWGPFSNSASEPFDTALVLLALAGQKGGADLRPLLRHGRTYLIKTQQEDGGWPATTRPPGVDSYAHRISTTGWALLALVATRDVTSPAPRKAARPSPP